MSAFAVDALDLSAPEAGGEQLDHDETFQSIAKGWNATVSEINGWMGWINAAASTAVEGWTPCPDLSDYEDLEGLVIYPLSGDYSKIRTNANACGILGAAIESWGDNFGKKIAPKVPHAFKGEASLALQGHLALYNAALAGVGKAVQASKVVYDGIAGVAEQLAVTIEDLIVKIGRRLLALVSKLVKRFGGWFGWANLVLDFIKGNNVVTDIVHDVQVLTGAIQTLLQAKETVETWAERAAEKLNKFKDVVTMITELPAVIGQTLSEPPVDLDAFRKKIEDLVPDYGGLGAPDISGKAEEAEEQAEGAENSLWGGLAEGIKEGLEEGKSR